MYEKGGIMKYVVCKTKSNELVLYDDSINKYIRESKEVVLRNKLLGDVYVNIDKDLNPMKYIILKTNQSGVADFFEIRDLNGTKLTIYADNQFICIKESDLSFTLYLGECEYVNGVHRKKSVQPINFNVLNERCGYKQIPLYRLYEGGCCYSYYDSMNDFVVASGGYNFHIKLLNNSIQSVYYV